MIRLNKYIAECGICSRRKADILIESGKVLVNDIVIKDLGVKIDDTKDQVKVDGKTISKEDKFVLFQSVLVICFPDYCKQSYI